MKKIPLLACLLYLVLCVRSQDWNYAVDRTVNHIKATVKFLEDKERVVIVPDENPGQRYVSEQLPEEYKKEGLRVTLSGQVGKIPPNVRLFGTPLRLSCICANKTEQKKFKLKKRKYVFN